jgi:hypothetical protein
MTEPRQTKMASQQPSPPVIEARRSQRVVARMRLNVRRSGAELSEDTHTLVVNAHGALLVLAMPVVVGEVLTLKNSLSNVEEQVRVVRVNDNEASPRPVAVEFTNPVPNFWPIAFPPADWEPRGYV